jgi:hypothetical protein
MLILKATLVTLNADQCKKKFYFLVMCLFEGISCLLFLYNFLPGRMHFYKGESCFLGLLLYYIEGMLILKAIILRMECWSMQEEMLFWCDVLGNKLFAFFYNVLPGRMHFYKGECCFLGLLLYYIEGMLILKAIILRMECWSMQEEMLFWCDVLGNELSAFL